jgi:hypothetical protein
VTSKSSAVEDLNVQNNAVPSTSSTVEVITQIQVVERIKTKNEMGKISKRKKQSKREKILDSGDEDANELEEEGREEEEEVGEKEVQKVREEVRQDDEVNINKWVLVQSWMKKTIRHFAGQVIGSSDEGWDVKYVKKSSSDDYNTKFAWPVFDDTDTVSEKTLKNFCLSPL